MAVSPKRTKSRFSDLVKFAPEDLEETPIQRKNHSGIQTNTLSANPPIEKREVPVSTKEEIYDEIDTQENYNYDEIESTPETFELEEDLDDGVIDESELNVKELTDEIDIEDEIEEDNKTGVETVERPVQSFGQQPEAKREFASEIKNINETIILGNTTIKGDIITDTGIQIYGAVLGNIESGGRVQLVGKVEGDITGKSVYVTNTSQSGNITAETEVHIKEGCCIQGNVKADRVFLKGAVIGDIEASGQVDFESGSEINGNVSAHSFNIKPGAKINGSISTN